jgi:hypothetical protein
MASVISQICDLNEFLVANAIASSKASNEF